MRCNKSILPLVVVCYLVVLIPTYSIAAPWVRHDAAPVNIAETSAFYDYRDHADATPPVVGGYFQLSAGIATGNLLRDYRNVLSVTAKHQETGFELNLLADDPCTSFLGRSAKYWELYLKPVSWMLTGTWEFTLLYRGSDRRMHEQVTTRVMGRTVFPVKPTNIEVSEGDDYFTVSWDGIGDSCSGTAPTNTRYRIVVLDANSCGVQEYRAACNTCLPPPTGFPNCEVTGTYDLTLNRVTFQVPLDYEGHLLRLDNQIVMGGQPSRACTYITLPTLP